MEARWVRFFGVTVLPPKAPAWARTLLSSGVGLLMASRSEFAPFRQRGKLMVKRQPRESGKARTTLALTAQDKRGFPHRLPEHPINRHRPNLPSSGFAEA